MKSKNNIILKQMKFSKAGAGHQAYETTFYNMYWESINEFSILKRQNSFSFHKLSAMDFKANKSFRHINDDNNFNVFYNTIKDISNFGLSRSGAYPFSKLGKYIIRFSEI